MGQELYSCDTTQIDVFTSARFTRHHACPMDNGWVPVGIYLVARSSRPRKSIHSAAPRPDPTTQGSLQVCRTGYSSFSQVSCCLVVGVIIAAPPPLVKEKFFRGGFRQPERVRLTESPSHRLTAATAPFHKGAFWCEGRDGAGICILPQSPSATASLPPLSLRDISP